MYHIVVFVKDFLNSLHFLKMSFTHYFNATKLAKNHDKSVILYKKSELFFMF